MRESKWLIYLNFTLFTVLFTCLLYTILHSVYSTQAQYPKEDLVSEQSLSFSVLSKYQSKNHNVNRFSWNKTNDELVPTVKNEVLKRMKTFAQFSALSSFCTTLPSPSPCLRNFTACVHGLNDVMSPVMTLPSTILYKFTTYGSDPLKGGEGFMSLYKKNQLVITFGGSTVLMDWINDFKAWLMPYPLPQDLFQSQTRMEVVKVHSGIFGVYEKMRKVLFKGLETCLYKYPGINQIVLTGHSLGGALAALFLFEVRLYQTLQISIERDFLLPKDIRFEYFSFGSPRLGNQAFVDFYQRLIWHPEVYPISFYRIMHPNDLVSVLPPSFLGYQPFPQSYFLANDFQSVYNCSQSSFFKCSFQGWTKDGHASYFWNMNRIKDKCFKLDREMFMSEMQQNAFIGELEPEKEEIKSEMDAVGLYLQKWNPLLLVQ